MNYKNLEIYKTEFDEQFLLLFENKTLLIGIIVKDIIEYLQQDIQSINIISIRLQEKYNSPINEESIKLIINRINIFIDQESANNFTKIFKILNPSKINTNFLNFLFSKNLFYILFFIFSLFNIFYYYFINKINILKVEHFYLYIILLLFLLFTHELGHSFAAKKYNINCKEIGLGIYLIFPVLYINLGESWKLKRFKRIIVNLGGIYFQLLVGFIILYSF